MICFEIAQVEIEDKKEQHIFYRDNNGCLVDLGLPNISYSKEDLKYRTKLDVEFTINKNIDKELSLDMEIMIKNPALGMDDVIYFPTVINYGRNVTIKATNVFSEASRPDNIPLFELYSELNESRRVKEKLEQEIYHLRSFAHKLDEKADEYIRKNGSLLEEIEEHEEKEEKYEEKISDLEDTIEYKSISFDTIIKLVKLIGNQKGRRFFFDVDLEIEKEEIRNNLEGIVREVIVSRTLDINVMDRLNVNQDLEPVSVDNFCSAYETNEEILAFIIKLLERNKEGE